MLGGLKDDAVSSFGDMALESLIYAPEPTFLFGLITISSSFSYEEAMGSLIVWKESAGLGTEIITY